MDSFYGIFRVKGYQLVPKSDLKVPIDAKGGGTMSNLLKCIMIALIVLYVVSPIDLAPGPLDDLIVILLGVAATRKNTVKEQ